MNNQDIFDLMARFDAGAATRMKLTTGNFTLELEKGGSAAPCAAPAAPVPAPNLREEAAAPQGPCVTAPLVGTFYTAPQPGRSPLSGPGRR